MIIKEDINMDENKAIQNPENTCFNCLKETAIHKISIPALGWRSQFDNFSTRIQLCDNCYKSTNPDWWKLNIIQGKTNWDGEYYEYENEILQFIEQMPLAGQELFYNRYATGADADDMEAQDWIDYKLDILPHEKCKEYGLYSPQEIQAYKERFPICQHPVNIIYEDGSKGCWCPFGAYGEYGQKVGLNICDECYECKYFKKRRTPIKYISEKDWIDYKIYYIVKLKEEEFSRFKNY
jgi:hypothetical protein